MPVSSSDENHEEKLASHDVIRAQENSDKELSQLDVHIKVQWLSGETLELGRFSSSATVQEVKQHLAAAKGQPAGLFKLLHAEHVLQGGETLSEACLPFQATLQCIVAVDRELVARCLEIVREVERTFDALEVQELTDFGEISRGCDDWDVGDGRPRMSNDWDVLSVCDTMINLLAGVDPVVELDARGKPKLPGWQVIDRDFHRLCHSLRNFKQYLERGEVPESKVATARKMVGAPPGDRSVEALSKKSVIGGVIALWVFRMIELYHATKRIRANLDDNFDVVDLAEQLGI